MLSCYRMKVKLKWGCNFPPDACMSCQLAESGQPALWNWGHKEMFFVVNTADVCQVFSHSKTPLIWINVHWLSGGLIFMCILAREQLWHALASVFITKGLSACHLLTSQCTSSSLSAGLHACMWLFDPRVGWVTPWKPVKQAASDQAWFVSLSAGCSHSLLMWERTTGPACWGQLDRPVEEHCCWTFRSPRMEKHCPHFLDFQTKNKKNETAKEEDSKGSCVWRKMWTCTVWPNLNKRLCGAL